MAFFIIYNTDTGFVEGWKKGNNAPITLDGQSFLEYEEQDNAWTGVGKKISNGLLVDDPDYVEVVDERLIRKERNRRLTSTDWTQLSDNGLSEEERASWQTYRQALRDLPTHSNWPILNDEDWPIK